VIKAIVFDCFGVIITDALAVILEELRSKNPGKAQDLVDLLNAASRGLISSEESTEQASELLGMKQEDYRQLIMDGEVKDERLLNYIRTLRKNYKTAILSNISNGGLHRRFTKKELDTYFDFVVASGDIGFGKPEAQAYEYTADGLGVRLTECVFLDDREEYCFAAQGVGMQAIQYQNFEQAKDELEKLLNNPEA